MTEDSAGGRTLRFVVIGAGMAGILSAIRLRQEGYTEVTVFEKADRLGGTWRENTYPGVACDVPSHLYSYSFELNPDWSHPYSPGGEIQAYLEDVARRHGVEELIRFGEEVTSLRWEDGCWSVTTASGHRAHAEVVIAATGVLHQPRYPDIAGIDDFAGAIFHSARWDHSVELDGARIGIVGTGSTAVQIVGAIVERVASLSLFQRTAQWVLPQENPPYPDSLKEELRLHPEQLAELHDNLSKLFAEGFANAVVDADSPQMRMIEHVCRDHLETAVRNPELRERLRPNYRAACKRLIVSGDFYEAIQAPNAELITDAIERIEPQGIRTADGRLHELDVIALCTGFRADAFLRPMAVVGRHGRTLDEAWAQRPNAYLSITIPGFPNLFLLNGPNGPVGNFSLIEVAELQFAYILQLVAELRSGACREICATTEAMEAFEASRVEAAAKTVWTTGCRSWYLDDRGIPATWPWPFDRFREEMAAPKPDAYERI